MGRMIFDLTDDDRAALEKLRAARGHRSQAETLRELIRGGIVEIQTSEPTVAVAATPIPADAPRFVKGIREPAEKPEAFKTRLKGEWKAP